MGAKEVKRCTWVEGKPDYYIRYHDSVWGTPEYNDQELFKWLSLELFHIGLSWQLVLSKYDNFMMAFDQFDYEKVAQYDEEKIAALLDNEGIIRHRKKIEATINNANRFVEVQKEVGSFSKYIWNFSDNQQILSESDDRPTSNNLSDLVTKDLKNRGFKFIGSVTIYSYLQAIGIINDHDLECDFR